MLTEIGRDELIALGSRVRAGNLTEQAGYTLGIAVEDGEALADLLERGYIDEVRRAATDVEAARGDKANGETEARDATGEQNLAVRRAKIWRRKIVGRGRRARRMGRKIPDLLVRITQASTVPAVSGQLAEMTKAVEANLAALGGDGARALLAEGQQIHGALSTADAEQERRTLSALPAAVREFYAKKGALYVGLKVVNDAGHELHADDAAAAARYNLKILHRRAPARKKEPGPGTT